jgi:hypothetical protein
MPGINEHQNQCCQLHRRERIVRHIYLFPFMKPLTLIKKKVIYNFLEILGSLKEHDS